MSESPNGESRARFPRKIYIIDRHYQWKYLLAWLAMTLGFVLVILGVLLIGLRLTNDLPLGRIPLGEVADLLKYNAVFIILVTVFLGCVALLLSHRVAGPAYRLSRSIERIRAGHYDFVIKLRQGDYLTEVAQGLNGLLLDLRARREKVDRVREGMSELAGQLGEGGDRVVKERLEEMARFLDGALAIGAPPAEPPTSGSTGAKA